MEKDISHPGLGGDMDDNNDLVKQIHALENLEHFSEKERGIVIVIGAHDIGHATAHAIMATLGHGKTVLVQPNKIDHLILEDIMLDKRPEPTMETLIQHISDDMQKRIAVMSDDITSYKEVQQGDITNKKQQEKRRRIHMKKKKPSSRKKG